MLMKKCLHPTCREYVEITKLNKGYCDKHKDTSDKIYNKYNRNDKYGKFYQSKEYKQFRKDLLRTHPYCEQCLKKNIYVKSRILHHKIEIKEDFSKRLDEDNVIFLCQACHNKIHKTK